jgi:hypothetical protein
MSTPNFANILSRKHDDAKEMTEFLGTADPRDYRKHARWFPLMVACHNAGVDRKVFIDWCTRDPHTQAAQSISVIGGTVLARLPPREKPQ